MGPKLLLHILKAEEVKNSKKRVNSFEAYRFWKKTQAAADEEDNWEVNEPWESCHEQLECEEARMMRTVNDGRWMVKRHEREYN